MNSSINSINGDGFRADGLSPKSRDRLTSALSREQKQFAKEITSALNQLSELDNSTKLREDAIRNGRAVIDNWQAPTDDQIKAIFEKLKHEYIKVG